MRRLFSVFAVFIGSSGIDSDTGMWMAPSFLWPTKTQLWCNRGAVGRQVRMKFGEDTVALATRATFCVVGIELGGRERAATEAHSTSWLQKALLAGKRLFGLEVSAAVAAHMWRTTVLAQGLHGCEIRNISHNQLRPLCVQGKVLAARKAPLDCLWSAIGCLCSSRPTLGSGCAAYALAAHTFQSGGPSWHGPSPVGQFFGWGLG